MTQKALTLTIVIPVYNEENYLLACLEAISEQTEVPNEVIVIDNNSTDKSMDIARKFSFVTVISESKQGISYARDRGFEASASTIIARIDGDTLLPPAWVERVKDFYTDPANAGQALTGGGYFYNCRWPRLAAFAQHYFAFYLNRLILGHHMLWGSNMALPKDMWQQVKSDVCHNQRIHEDLDLGIHLWRQGFGVSYRRKLRVGVVMKRVFKNHDRLLPHLKQWPYTFRYHKLRLWALSWIGVAVVYFCCWGILLSERIWPTRGLK